MQIPFSLQSWCLILSHTFIVIISMSIPCVLFLTDSHQARRPSCTYSYSSANNNLFLSFFINSMRWTLLIILCINLCALFHQLWMRLIWRERTNWAISSVWLFIKLYQTPLGDFLIFLCFFFISSHMCVIRDIKFIAPNINIFFFLSTQMTRHRIMQKINKHACSNLI